jgi:hypothetical protein
VLSAGDLAQPSPAFKLASRLHAAAFAVALPALSTTTNVFDLASRAELGGGEDRPRRRDPTRHSLGLTGKAAE